MGGPENSEGTIAGERASERHVSLPALRPENYSAMLEGMEMTDAQAKAFLETLWSIMCAFVELGFGSESIQRILPAVTGLSVDDSGDLVDLNHPNTEQKQRSRGCDNDNQT
ncbi:MAG: hypothetical protein AAFR68_20460 [Pseudomonadota bacterium]